MKDEPDYLDPKRRSAVMRETFDAIMAVGFMKWKAEELALGNELTEEDRQLYFREFEKDYFAGFQKLAANASDDRLLAAMEFWIDKSNAMGLKEWQRVLSAGRGARPWYEAMAKEVEGREQGHPAESRETPSAAGGGTSVLGYALPEPSPSPPPQQDRNRGR